MGKALPLKRLLLCLTLSVIQSMHSVLNGVSIFCVSLYVSGDCEIVSINAFERLPPKTGLVVGITYIMAS